MRYHGRVRYLRWRGTPADINVDKSTEKSKYLHRFRVFKFHNSRPKNVLIFFEKVKLVKATAGYELMTYKFVINTLTNYGVLLGNKYGKN